MDRSISRIGGAAKWQNDPEGARADSRKGGETTKERYGKVHFLKAQRLGVIARRNRRLGSLTSKKAAILAVRTDRREG